MNYKPPQSPALSMPITSSNVQNGNNHPAQVLGNCTPSQLLFQVGVKDGTVCVLGDPLRSIEIIRALQRRSGKPLLFVGFEADRPTAMALAPDRILNTPQAVSGSCVVLLDRADAYCELVEALKMWTQSHFTVLRLGNGLSLGGDAMSILAAGQSSVILTDWVPQAVRSGEWGLTPSELLKRAKCIFATSSAGAAKELVELLPKYACEIVTNTSGFNTFNSHSVFHPLHLHCGHGISVSQSRSTDYRKASFEEQELKHLFENGTILAYNAVNNSAFLAQLT